MSIMNWFNKLYCQFKGHKKPVAGRCPRCGATIATPPAPEPGPVPSPTPQPEPTGDYPWVGKTLIDATESSRAHDAIHEGPEAHKLDYAKIVGGQCQYSPRFMVGWVDRGHMTSRAILMFRFGDLWYRSAFSGWADAAGHDAREGSWCATNEFTTWNSPDPLRSDELWFAVAQRSGGARSSFARIW